MTITVVTKDGITRAYDSVVSITETRGVVSIHYYTPSTYLENARITLSKIKRMYYSAGSVTLTESVK